MSAETLKAAIAHGDLFYYYDSSIQSHVIHADILALIAQERKEAVAEYANNKSRFDALVNPVPAVDPQKQRLDEFTLAILAGMLANQNWQYVSRADLAIQAKEQALAQMAENDK